MKKIIISCDLCGEEIPSDETPFIIKTGEGARKKQVGSDIILTPRGNRLHANVKGGAMIRVNASFYCGSYASNLEELHFHHTCLNTEVRNRVVEFFKGEIE
jgi:hypothetical protein